MSKRVEVPYDAMLRETLAGLADPGLLLVTKGSDGRLNAMTIGWGSVGLVWGMPVFQVLVRPSRHTYKLLQENGDFTVNLMPADMTAAVEICGTTSGRDVDKFKQLDLAPDAALTIRTPLIRQSVLAYECRTVLTCDVESERLDPAIVRGSYAGGNFHRVFFGHILAARAAAKV